MSFSHTKEDNTQLDRCVLDTKSICFPRINTDRILNFGENSFVRIRNVSFIEDIGKNNTQNVFFVSIISIEQLIQELVNFWLIFISIHSFGKTNFILFMWNCLKFFSWFGGNIYLKTSISFIYLSLGFTLHAWKKSRNSMRYEWNTQNHTYARLCDIHKEKIHIIDFNYRVSLCSIQNNNNK